MGVKFVGVSDRDAVVVIALNPETTAEVAAIDEAVVEESAEVQQAAAALASAEDDVQVSAEPGVLETGEHDDPSVDDDEQTSFEGDEPASDGEENDDE
jgi:hypothetical protein